MNSIREHAGPHPERPEAPAAGDDLPSTSPRLTVPGATPAPPLSPLSMCFYNLGMLASWPVRSGYCFLRAHTDGKYRDSLWARAGLILPRPLTGKPRVWFHALSVGETLSVVPLVKALKERRPHLEILFSTSTETGQSMAQKHLAPWVERFSYLPYDLPWVMESLVRRHRPSLFVLVETDIWPNLLRALQRQHVPAVLVNGRLSPQSSRNMRRFRSFFGPLLGYFTCIFAQSVADSKRYRALGVPSQRLRVSGNLKYDASLSQPVAGDPRRFRSRVGIEPEQLAWIAGSTHEGEEAVLLRVHRQLREQHPELLLILAPRHIERTARIEALCSEFGFATATRSRGQSAAGKAVYLLDTLGELSSWYGLADVAYIGGSLVAFGGHNPIEAVAQGKPAVWGPHLFNFREIEADLIQAGCGRRVASAGELLEVVDRWLQKKGLREELQAAAGRFLAEHGGSSGRLAEFLDRLLPQV